MKQITFVFLFLSVVAFPKNLALKNFMEIYSSLQVSTNIKPDKILNAKYLEVRELLPQNGLIVEYTTPMQLGLIKLAGDFCQRRVTQDAALGEADRWLHHGVDFAKAPSELTEKDRLKLIAEYADAFWQRTPTKEEEASLLASYGSLAALISDSKMFFGFYCIAFGSSMNFLTI